MTLPSHPRAAAWYAAASEEDRYLFDERCAIIEFDAPDVYQRMRATRTKDIEGKVLRDMGIKAAAPVPAQNEPNPWALP